MRLALSAVVSLLLAVSVRAQSTPAAAFAGDDPAAGPWILVHADDDQRVFLDTTSVVRDGDVVSATMWWAHVDIQRFDGVAPFDRALVRESNHCAMTMARAASVEGYLSGERTGSESYGPSEPPRLLTPGTVGRAVLDTVCREAGWEARPRQSRRSGSPGVSSPSRQRP